MKFLLNNNEFDQNDSGKNWDWKIVTDEELHCMLDNREFNVCANGYAKVGIYALRDINGHGCAYNVMAHYVKSGWVVCDLMQQIFLKG